MKIIPRLYKSLADLISQDSLHIHVHVHVYTCMCTCKLHLNYMCYKKLIFLLCFIKTWLLLEALILAVMCTIIYMYTCTCKCTVVINTPYLHYIINSSQLIHIFLSLTVGIKFRRKNLQEVHPNSSSQVVLHVTIIIEYPAA